MKNNKNRFFKSLLFQCLGAAFLFPVAGYAQISITNNQTATQLATNLVGGGVTISNATLNCPGLSNGIFSVTSSNLGLNNGILLTSGSASAAAGLASTNPSSATGNGSDADLNALVVPNSSFDKCILEFDFVPLSDSIKFQYVFSSVEYDNYTCSSYTDVFGFFLSGPGIAGPYSNNAVNLALVPGTTCPVAVNTINGSTSATCGNFVAPCTNNGIYFVQNILGTSVAHNGFTTVLLAQSGVTPGQTHHLKLAIADAADQSLDSGVWLKEASLTSATSTVTNCGPYTWPVNGVTYTASGVYTFTLPSGNLQILDLTIFCPTTVPTISQWGLIILALITLTFGMILLYRRENGFALAGNKKD